MFRPASQGFTISHYRITLCLELFQNDFSGINWHPGSHYWTFSSLKLYITCSPQAQTSSGNIVDHIAPNTSEVYEFLGIPYAKPPINTLHFAPPDRVFTNSTFNAPSL
jgi:hypothetical protein